MNLTYKFIEWDFGSSARGSVQKGHRPAFVVKDYEDGHMLLAAVTSKIKPLPTHVYLSKEVTHLPKNSIILLEQLFWATYNRSCPPVAVADIQNKKIERIIQSKLRTSLGMSPVHTLSKDLSPVVCRGQVFNNKGKEMVVLQNDVGNYYSPTTIIGDLRDGKISTIRTVERDVLLESVLKGRRRNVSQEVRELIV